MKACPLMDMNTTCTKQVGPVPLRYGVVLADPPWNYRNSSGTYGRRIERHYPTMNTDAICALDVPSARDAVLYLWSTSPHLPDALKVMEAWGFAYRSSMVWDKVMFGMGYWARIQHELLLVGVKGKFCPPARPLRVRSVLTIPRTVHSRKPPEVRDLIASWYPNARKLEMFARQRAEGWDAWGNELECDVEIRGAGLRDPHPLAFVDADGRSVTDAHEASHAEVTVDG
jgi:N6-adenosine-specific RNA methylase IME4